MRATTAPRAHRRGPRWTTSTIGAAEGSIIAAIIVTQTPTNQPRPPRSVPGPASMPRIRSIVTIQVTSAAASSRRGDQRPGRGAAERAAPVPTGRPPVSSSAEEYSKVDS